MANKRVTRYVVMDMSPDKNHYPLAFFECFKLACKRASWLRLNGYYYARVRSIRFRTPEAK